MAVRRSCQIARRTLSYFPCPEHSCIIPDDTWHIEFSAVIVLCLLYCAGVCGAWWLAGTVSEIQSDFCPHALHWIQS